MTFCAAINCLDGRTQLPVNNYLMKRFNVKYVDMLTDAGPLGILTNDPDSPRAEFFIERVNTVIRVHDIKELAITGHWDCRGNPQPKETQFEQIRTVVLRYRGIFPNLTIIGLWVDEDQQVHEIEIEA
tara:strand:- start:562 stop:945 length:384 start_codon:yes stop_codon:yes gene_type:complete